LHQKVLEEVSKEGQELNMNNWHTCSTTHCRAGWIVHIAGQEGYDLERKTDSSFAAQLILRESTDIPIGLHKFFWDKKSSMSDIIRCAELEKSNNKL